MPFVHLCSVRSFLFLNDPWFLLDLAGLAIPDFDDASGVDPAVSSWQQPPGVDELVPPNKGAPDLPVFIG